MTKRKSRPVKLYAVFYVTSNNAFHSEDFREVFETRELARRYFRQIPENVRNVRNQYKYRIIELKGLA